MKYLFTALWLTFIPLIAQAEETFLTTVGFSHHLNAKEEMNEKHPGIGVEYWFGDEDDVALLATTFVDSFDYQAGLIGVGQQFWKGGDTRLVIGAVILHKKLSFTEPGVTFPAPLSYLQFPVIKRLYGNFAVFPPIGTHDGILFLQFKLKI